MAVNVFGSAAVLSSTVLKTPFTSLDPLAPGLNVFAEPLTATVTGRASMGCPRWFRTVTVTLALSTALATTNAPLAGAATTVDAAGSGSRTVTFRTAASDRTPVSVSVATTRNAGKLLINVTTGGLDPHASTCTKAVPTRPSCPLVLMATAETV